MVDRGGSHEVEDNENVLMRCFNLVSVFNKISNLIKEMSGETVYYRKLHRFFTL